MEEITKKEIVELFNENGLNIFGKFASEIAELIADEVIEEYNEAGDGDLQKAISYVIGDKFGMFNGI
jgi:RNase P/RNase MRP subunit POP5